MAENLAIAYTVEKDRRNIGLLADPGQRSMPVGSEISLRLTPPARQGSNFSSIALMNGSLSIPIQCELGIIRYRFLQIRRLEFKRERSTASIGRRR